MSDEKLRELERRFKETGSVDDEAAWLNERVRVGDLKPEVLQLAADVGHQAARLAIGPGCLGMIVDVGVKAWVSRIDTRLSQEQVLRILISLGQSAIEISPPVVGPFVDELREELERAEAVASSPRSSSLILAWIQTHVNTHPGWNDELATDEEFDELGWDGKCVFDLVLSARSIASGAHLSLRPELTSSLDNAVQLLGSKAVQELITHAIGDP